MLKHEAGNGFLHSQNGQLGGKKQLAGETWAWTNKICKRLGKATKAHYAPWNVECLTNTQNCQARKTNGVAAKGDKSGCHKLTDNQAKEIFLASGTLEKLAQ